MTEDSLGENARRKLARERWMVLRRVLLDKKPLCMPSRSSRLHNTLSLFEIQEMTDTEGKSPKDHIWLHYGCEDVCSSVVSVLIKKPPHKLSTEDLQVKDNTGNICIWASEQVMAYYCIKNMNQFAGKAVIEIGGGFSCLAGMFVAKYGNAKRVVLSDGNEKSLANVAEIAQRNSLRKAELLHLSWDESATFSEIVGQFDILLCADCLFADNNRQQLALTMFELLKPCGEALVFAPKRGRTLDVFVVHAKEIFGTSNVAVVPNYDDEVGQFHKSKLECPSYDENIHYPLLLRLKKAEKTDKNFTPAYSA